MRSGRRRQQAHAGRLLRPGSGGGSRAWSLYATPPSPPPPPRVLKDSGAGSALNKCPQRKQSGAIGTNFFFSYYLSILNVLNIL